jgi:hypothetical protein
MPESSALLLKMLIPTVQMEKFVWQTEITSTRVEWRCVSMATGAQCVTTDGTIGMLVSSAISWAILVAFRLLCLMLDLVAGVDSSSWTMWIVTEQNQISSSVEGTNQGTTTVDLLRMPVFSALTPRPTVVTET